MPLAHSLHGPAIFPRKFPLFGHPYHMALFSVRGSLSLFSLCSLALSTFVQASLTSAQLSEYLDTGSAVTWQGAAGDWRLESTAGFTKDGVDSIRTPLLENSASTDFSCTVNGPGVLRRVSESVYASR